MTVRVLTEGMRTGAENMSRDAGLAEALRRREIGPAIRIYGWDPPAVSIGYHQDEEDFDAAALAAAGVGLVRRPTGGRAILHAHEVTYCAVLPLSAGTPRSIYRMINEALLDALRSMGIPARLSDDDPDLRRALAAPEGIPCFSVAVRSEIRSGGKKIVGSAQRRYGDVILQHGSFLLGTAHREIARFVRSGAAAIGADLAAHTTEAETVLGRSVGFAEAAGAVAAAFERYFTRVRELREPPARHPASATLQA
jgi:lipoate-protein ligase A